MLLNVYIFICTYICIYTYIYIYIYEQAWELIAVEIMNKCHWNSRHIHAIQPLLSIESMDPGVGPVDPIGVGPVDPIDEGSSRVRVGSVDSIEGSSRNRKDINNKIIITEASIILDNIHKMDFLTTLVGIPTSLNMLKLGEKSAENQLNVYRNLSVLTWSTIIYSKAMTIKVKKSPVVISNTQKVEVDENEIDEADFEVCTCVYM
jgi:hypothetical protein